MTGSGRVPVPATVGHVMISVGVRSQTFIDQAIDSVQRRGWEPRVIGLHHERDLASVPAELTHCTGRGTALERGWGLLSWQSPQRRFARRVTSRGWARRVSLIHAHFGWSGVYAAPLARVLDVPMVVTYYGSDALVRPHPQRLRRGEVPGKRWLPHTDVFAEAARVIAVSECVERALRGLHYTGIIDVIRNGIDITRFPFRDRPPSLRDGPRLIFVGRLVPFKGADVLIRAMPRILREQPSARLEVVGDGPESDALHKLTRDLGLGTAVSFRGMISHARTVEAMAAAHVLIVPSRVMPDGATDSSSMVFKEALALGVPVVATHVGGLTETCPPAVAPELVAPEDPEAIARGVLSVVSDPRSWPWRTAVGREWVSGRYSSQDLGDRLEQCYVEAIGGYRRRVRLGAR